MTQQLSKDQFLTDVFDYENKQDWEYQGDVPCIIDFYADWCQPCKIVSPILEELATEYEGKLKVYKVNTEVEQELAGAFGIQSIPSLLFIPVDDQPQMAVGALPKESIKQAMKDVLGVE